MKKSINKLISSKGLMIFASLFGLYLLATGTSWAIFSYLRKSPNLSSGDIATNRSRIADLPKTEECPINGKMYSEPEREIWEERRPITAVIENHEESRPQSGISRADVVYEAVAEGGITRFLAVFYCGASASDLAIAPVRSARVYFIDWAAEYGAGSPLFVHIGGANNICGNCPGGVKPRGQIAPEVNAFALLDELGWRYASGNDFDGGTNIGFPIIVRDQYRLGEQSAWEHSVVGYTDKIFEEAERRGFGYEENGSSWTDEFTSWQFKDDSALSNPEADGISFEFWSNKGNYDVTWEYDQSSNSYLRFNGGVEHTDHDNKEQISAKNVVIMFVDETGPVDQEKHMYYETIGEGEAIIFQNGDVIEGTWEKDSVLDRTVFYDSQGQEIEFVRGQIWIEAVPSGNEIDY